jgi:hypothetical protein
MTSKSYKAKIKRMGRPPVDTAPINVRFAAEVIQEIDDWRRHQADLPGRPEAIRRLVEQALEKQGKSK